MGKMNSSNLNSLDDKDLDDAALWAVIKPMPPPTPPPNTAAPSPSSSLTTNRRPPPSPTLRLLKTLGTLTKSTVTLLLLLNITAAHRRRPALALPRSPRAAPLRWFRGRLPLRRRRWFTNRRRRICRRGLEVFRPGATADRRFLLGVVESAKRKES